MLTGENGILTQAQNAQRETERANLIEEVQTEVMGKQAEEGTANLDRTDLKGILDNYFETVPNNFTKDTELQTIKDKYGDYQIKVSEVYAEEIIEGPKTAGDVLIPNASGGTEEEKSPFVEYNGILCRVLYNDDTHGLQIVSDDNVEDVTLGDDDPTVTADDFNYDGPFILGVGFKKAAASYNNLVDTLNNKAKEYMDENAIDARSIGSIATLNGEGKFQGDTSGLYSGGESYLDDYEFKDEDTNYTEDIRQINTLGLNTSTTLMASRFVRDSSGFIFCVRILSPSSNWFDGSLGYVYSSGSTNYFSITYGFRP